MRPCDAACAEAPHLTPPALEYGCPHAAHRRPHARALHVPPKAVPKESERLTHRKQSATSCTSLGFFVFQSTTSKTQRAQVPRKPESIRRVHQAPPSQRKGGTTKPSLFVVSHNKPLCAAYRAHTAPGRHSRCENDLGDAMRRGRAQGART